MIDEFPVILDGVTVSKVIALLEAQICATTSEKAEGIKEAVGSIKTFLAQNYEVRRGILTAMRETKCHKIE